MACNQKKPPQQRPKSNRFLACFGITSKSDKKRNKTGGSSESWFKLCMPKIKIIIIRRRKGKGKGKGKGRGSIIKLETTKIQQVKMNHALITQEVTKNTIPVVIQSNDQQKRSNDQRDLQSPRENQSDEGPSRAQMPISTVKKCDEGNKVRKDSLVGVSIMVITLIIMTFWGYLYAIICMSAWLYCLPLLRMYKDGGRPNLMANMSRNHLNQKLKLMVEVP